MKMIITKDANMTSFTSYDIFELESDLEEEFQKWDLTGLTPLLHYEAFATGKSPI